MDKYGFILLAVGIVILLVAGDKPERKFWSRFGYFTFGFGFGWAGASIATYYIVMGQIDQFLR